MFLVHCDLSEVSWQSFPLLILPGLNTSQRLPTVISMSSHAPATLLCNGFILPYNPFTPWCSEYPLCFLSLLWPAPHPPSPPSALSPFLHPSLYPFRSVSMSLEDGDWCVSQRLVLFDAVRPSLSHGGTSYVGLCLHQLHTEPVGLVIEAYSSIEVIPAFQLRVWMLLNGNMCTLCTTYLSGC